MLNKNFLILIIVVQFIAIIYLGNQVLFKNDWDFFEKYSVKGEEIFIAKNILDGTPINIGVSVNKGVMLKGFSIPEGNHRWTTSKNPEIMLLVDNKNNSDVVVEMDANLFMSDKQTATVKVNGKDVYKIDSSSQSPHKIIVSKEDIKNNIIALKFNINEPLSPKSAGRGEDERTLGLDVRTMRLYEHKPLSLNGEKLFMGIGGSAAPNIKGFYPRENEGMWTQNNKAEIEIKVDNQNNKDISVEIDGYIFQGDKQSVKVLANGEKEVFTINGNTVQPYRFVISAEDMKNNTVKLVFVVDNPLSPHSLGLGDDARMLGMFVKSVSFTESAE